jgi:hypothetical protein
MSNTVTNEIEYSAEIINQSIEINLTSKGNPALYHYYENDLVWELFSEAINDESFMKIVIFNNDYMKIAPVHTFCSYYIDGKVDLRPFEKNSVGRLFKYVFRVLGYNEDIRVSNKNHDIQYGKVFVK